MRLPQGHTSIIDGPASIRILSGEASILGCPLKLRRNYLLRPWRRYPVYAETDVEFEVSLGEGASQVEIEGSTIDQTWLDAAKRLIGKGVVVIVGGIDAGKTTFATLLSNLSVRSRGRCVAVDLDPGQSYLSPPTTIGAAELSKPYHDLAQAEAIQALPVGSTSPAPVLEYHLKMSGQLMNIVRGMGSDDVVVDCDGWVEGEAAERYKARLMEVIQPSHAVFMYVVKESLKQKLEELGIQYSVLKGPQHVLRRDSEARRKIREMSYRRFLHNSSLRTLPITWVELTTIAAEALSDSMPAVEYFRQASLQYGEDVGVKELKLDRVSDILLKAKTGLLTYLFGVDGKYLGIGIMAEIDVRKGVLRMFTPVTGQVRRAVLGNVFISVFGDELSVVKMRD